MSAICRLLGSDPSRIAVRATFRIANQGVATLRRTITVYPQDPQATADACKRKNAHSGWEKGLSLGPEGRWQSS